MSVERRLLPISKLFLHMLTDIPVSELISHFAFVIARSDLISVRFHRTRPSGSIVLVISNDKNRRRPSAAVGDVIPDDSPGLNTPGAHRSGMFREDLMRRIKPKGRVEVKSSPPSSSWPYAPFFGFEYYHPKLTLRPRLLGRTAGPGAAG